MMSTSSRGNGHANGRSSEPLAPTPALIGPDEVEQLLTPEDRREALQS
jgi:hypothetical protein